MESIAAQSLYRAPFGYSYHQVVFDEQGQPEDYVFLEVNPAFERLTGLKRENLIQQRATTIIPGLRSPEFDWVATYGKIALGAEPIEFKQFVPALHHWYRVSAFSPARGYFVTVFLDVTEEQSLIDSLEQQRQETKQLDEEMDTILRTTHDAMFLARVQDGVFRYLRNNRAHRELTGFSLDSILNKTPVDLFGPAIGEGMIRNFQRCLDLKEPINYEETLASPLGTRIWDTTLAPSWKNGKIEYIVGSRRDITEIKKAEAEKEAIAKRFQAMFEKHMAVMLLIEPASGRIVDANPSAIGFYGYTREELTALNISSLNMLPQAEIKSNMSSAMAAGQNTFLFPHRKKNGDIRQVEVYSSPFTVGSQTLLFSIIFDVTDREQNKESLYLEQELLRTTLQSIGDGVVTTDVSGCITSLNEVASKLTGWSPKEAIGRHFSDVFVLLNEATRETVENPVAKVLERGIVVGLANHTVLVHKSGVSIPIADSAAPIRNNKGDCFGVVMVFRDVSEQKEHEEEVLYLSYRDYLTGLVNRRFMEEELNRMNNHKHLPVSVIMGDVNGLKLTNDVFGHETGDLLLQKAAKALHQSCRKSDIVARWGGDEFLVLLPQTDMVAAERVIERIQEACVSQSDGTAHLSISLGCSVMASAEEDIHDVLKETEERMYRHKLLEGKSYRNSIINMLMSTLFEKSGETEEHALRLKDHCLALGSIYHLSTKELDELSLLSMLHDIGKVGIDERILKKPGALGEEEWVEMKKHTEIGYRIAQNTPELSGVAEFILSHHERWDGHGYPRGLREQDIPIHCRILSVVDAYDAMVYDRVYRPAMREEEALRELQRNAGTQFDAGIVKHFLALRAAAGVSIE